MFSDPLANVIEFGFLPGSKVADLGSGAGHYAMALSTALGPEGKVIAIDLNSEMLVRLKNEAESTGRSNIEIISGDIEEQKGTKLADNFCDGAVFSNILFQLEHRERAIEEAARIIKPGGKACVVEWADLLFLQHSKGTNPGVVTEEKAKELFLKAGFKLERTFQAGEHHYGLIFSKSLQ